MAAVTEVGALSIGYKGKMFKKPECKYNFVAKVPEGETPEESKLLEAAFQKLWKSGFDKLKKQKAKEIQVAMEKTEKEFAKKDKTEAEVKKFIETANKMIEQGIEVWRKNQVPALADQIADKVHDYVQKKLKRKIAKKKFMCALKITGLVLIVLAVAVTAVAVSVATMGAGTPAMIGVIAGAVVTGVGAAYKIYNIVQKEAVGLDKSLKEVAAELEKVDKAYDYQLKKEAKLLKGGKLGPKEKFKLLTGGVSPHISSLQKKMKDCETYVHGVRSNAKKTMDKVMAAEEELRKAEKAGVSGSAKKAFDSAREARYKAGRQLEKLYEKLGKYSELKSEVDKAVSEFEKKGDWPGSAKASKLTKFLQENGPQAKEIGTNLMTIGKNLKKLAG